MDGLKKVELPSFIVDADLFIIYNSDIITWKGMMNCES